MGERGGEIWGRGEALRTHHERVDEDVVVLERVEGRGGGDAVLAGLAELQPRHDGGEPAEDEVVEHLHGGGGGGGGGASRWGRERERDREVKWERERVGLVGDLD